MGLGIGVSLNSNMSNLVRTAKFLSSWSSYDLDAFNISIVPTGVRAFFGVPELPPSSFANNVVLNSCLKPDNTDGLSEDEEGFFFYLDIAEDDKPEEPAVGDLAAFLLRFCNFSGRDLFIRRRPTLSRWDFEIFGERTGEAMVDVALVDRYNDYLLLVKEDKVGSFRFIYIYTDV